MFNFFIFKTGRGTAKANVLWIVLPLVLIAQMAEALAAQGIPVLYPFIQAEFELSRTQVGLITSTYTFGGILAIMLAGWMTDRFGVKRVLMVSLSALAILTVLFPLIHFWYAFLILVALIGIASSPSYPATTRAVMDWVPGRVRGLAMSFKQSGFAIAGVVTAAILPALAVASGWRTAAATMGLLIFVIAVAFLLLYRDAPREKKMITPKFNYSTMLAILRDRGRFISMTWMSVFVGFQYILLSYFMLFLIEELQFSPIKAGGVLAVAQISSSLARVLWGGASDFLFHGRRKIVLIITGFTTAIAMFATSLVNSVLPSSSIFLIAGILGISSLSFHGVSTTLIGELANREQIGTTIGMTSLANRICMITLPPLFGFLVDLQGSYVLGWRLVAAVALVFTLAFIILGREPKRD